MTHNLIYDHKGKMIASSSGNLIALPPARHWMELQKEKNLESTDIMSVFQEGESLTFKASYSGHKEKVKSGDPISDAVRVDFGIISKYTLVSDPEHGLEIQATMDHSPDIFTENPNSSGGATAKHIIYVSAEAGRHSWFNRTTTIEDRVWVPEDSTYKSEYYILLTPDTRGLDYRSHLQILIDGWCGSSKEEIRKDDSVATWGYTYNRPPMTYTLTIKKVKL